MSIGIRVAKIRLLDTRQSFRLGAEHRLEPDEWPELATHRFCLPQTEPVDHLIASAPYVRNPRIDYLDPSTIEIREETSARPNDGGIISAPREKCLGTSTARGDLRLLHNSIRSPSSATSTPLNARGALRDRCVSTTRRALIPPPQRGQRRISMSKTRLSSAAQSSLEGRWIDAAFVVGPPSGSGS